MVSMQCVVEWCVYSEWLDGVYRVSDWMECIFDGVCIFSEWLDGVYVVSGCTVCIQ